MTDKSPQEVLQALSDEHDVVHQQIADLQQFWREVSQLGAGPKYEEMGDRVRSLRDMLARHFSSEERSGYLTPAVAAAPRFEASAERLQREHPELLRTLDEFIGRLATCESAYHCWQEVRAEFDEFLRRLEKHEGEEMSIVRQAIDLGAKPNA